MRNTPKNFENMSGNALVIVLILIALLAALTITLTRMGSTTQEVSQEQAQTIASQVLRQGRSMANAVDGLIAKGCSVTELSFENTVVTGYTNAQSPADKSCWLFDGAGAGMAFPSPPSSSNDGTSWTFQRNNKVAGVGVERETGVLPTGQSQDLLMFLPLVNLNVCKSINYQAGVTTSYDQAPPVLQNSISLNFKFSASGTSPSDNNYSSQGTTGSIILVAGAPFNSTALWDKKTACAEAAGGYVDAAGTSQAGTGKYFFYQVLLER